jgi:hypothetical protein
MDEILFLFLASRQLQTDNCKMEVRKYIYYSTAIPVCDTGRSCLQPIHGAGFLSVMDAGNNQEHNQKHKEIFDWTIRFFYCYI